MASIFNITEEELFNFESFCDSKYLDPNCQKYGYFKVKLNSQYDGQCSTIDDFFQLFGVKGQGQIRKSVLFSNVNDKNLFGMQNVSPSSSEKEYFMSTSFDPEAFQDPNLSTNCCMNVLRDQGKEAFLQHFYAKVTLNPKVKGVNIHDDIRNIRSRALAKRKAFTKRQAYQSCVSMEGKKRCSEMAISNEKILVSSPAQEECLCEICDVRYCHKAQGNSKNCGEYGSCDLLYSAGIEESQNNYIYITKNFAMAHLCFKNMLADLDGFFGGVSCPYLYLGGFHSLFPLHIEDLSLWSFNFLLHGLPKFWIIIPPSSVSMLTDALHRRGFFQNHRWCRNNLSHKFYIPTIEFFKEENIPFSVVIQQKGEGIVLLPNAAHTGGNLGPNLAEACNFGTPKWIPYGCVALKCPCMEGMMHADLIDAVAVHAPDLLQAYLNNNIYDIVQDKYFHDSLVVRKRCSEVEPSSMKSQKKPAAFVNSTRVKCPVCNVSWAYVQKANIMTHLNKYHAVRMNDDIVIKFLDSCSLLRM